MLHDMLVSIDARGLESRKNALNVKMTWASTTPTVSHEISEQRLDMIIAAPGTSDVCGSVGVDGTWVPEPQDVHSVGTLEESPEYVIGTGGALLAVLLRTSREFPISSTCK
jgi:hypothetical protein